MPTRWLSSNELEQLLCMNAKRNSLAASLCFLIACVLGCIYKYGDFVNLMSGLMSVLFFFLSTKTNDSNFRKYERFVFLSSTAIVVLLLFISNSITTVVIFLPSLAYLFLVENNKRVQYVTLAIILISVLMLSARFLPELTIGSSNYDLRFEAFFDVIVASIFTGVFVRFHIKFRRLSVKSANLQSEEHDMYVAESKAAHTALAEQKKELNRLYVESRVALLNERLSSAQIAASQDQLEQFSYAASHDLKEPIRTIRSFLQVVRRRLPAEVIEEEGLAEHFEFVEQSSETMHNLLERLLLYSRIDRMSSSKKEIGLVSLLRRICITGKLGLEEVDADVSVKLPDGVSEVEVYFNEDHAFTVFLELFKNAVLFRSNERKLEINIEIDIIDDKTILVSFADNGIGIEGEYHELVFGLFKRLNTREDYPGSGLGLSLVREVLSAGGGQVSLTSMPGEGTQVHLLLPRKGTS